MIFALLWFVLAGLGYSPHSHFVQNQTPEVGLGSVQESLSSHDAQIPFGLSGTPGTRCTPIFFVLEDRASP